MSGFEADSAALAAAVSHFIVVVYRASYSGSLHFKYYSPANRLLI
jgi:hypothetical protein